MELTQSKNKLLTTEEAAALVGLSPETLANHRTSGKSGLKFLRLGRSVRYRQSDLEAWLDSCVCTSTGD